MTPLDALARILLLAQPADSAIAAAPDAKLPGIAVGQQVTAKVVEQLPNGNFRISIDNQPLQVNLPQGIKVGDSISLVLVSKDPRLTFNLAMPQPGLPQQTPDLSLTGKLVALLLPDPSKPGPPLTSPNPVLSSPPQAPEQLAVALEGVLTQSGLFYESHLAQWVNGEHPLAKLLLEPQNAQPAVPQAQTPWNGQKTDFFQPKSAMPLVPESASSPVISTDASRPIETMPAPASALSAVSQTAMPVKEATLPIVQQQIGALETREINWSGQVWPGQAMDWQIREDDRERSSPGEPPLSWQSRLRLVLPRLGEVEANLRLTPLGVQIALHAATAESMNQMKQNGPVLQESLAAAGLPLVSVTVGNG